jgi:hypothetical protein
MEAGKQGTAWPGEGGCMNWHSALPGGTEVQFLQKFLSKAG